MAPRFAPPPKAGPEKLGQAEYDRQLAAHRAWLASVAGTPEPEQEEPTVTRTRAVRDGDVATFAYTAKIRVGGRTREVKVRVQSEDKASAMAAGHDEVMAMLRQNGGTLLEERCNRPRGVPFQKGGDDRQVQHVAAQAGGKGGEGKAESSKAEGAEDGEGEAEGEAEGEEGLTPLNGDTPGEGEGEGDLDAEDTENDTDGFGDEDADEGDEGDEDAEDADEAPSKGEGKGKGAPQEDRQQEAKTLEQIAQSLKAQQEAQKQTKAPKQAEAECDLILLRKSAPPAEGAAAAVLVGGIAASVTKPVIDGALESLTALTGVTKAGLGARPTTTEVARMVGTAVTNGLKGLKVDPASVDTAVAKAVSKLGVDEAKLERTVSKLVTEALKPVQRTVELVVKRDGATITTVSGAHVALRKVIQRVVMQDNVALIGPTGCGKTHLALQLAKVLGRPVYVQSLSGGISESAITGRYLPMTVDGKWGFISTRFIDLYENGGIYIGDEMDGADPNVLLVLNAALANGVIGLPNRHTAPEARRHPEFVFIGTFNTWGAGSNRLYCGRNAIDGATMDRFRTGTVEMDYDRALERELVQGPGSDEYLARLWAIRDAVNAHRIPQNVSTRFVLKAWEYRTTQDPTTKAPMWSMAEVEEALLGGWTVTERAKVPARAA